MYLTFSTAFDHQSAITIHMLEGDSTQAAQCLSLAKFDIQGITASQAQGDPQLEVTFEIDGTGTLSCHAQERPDKMLRVRGQSVQVQMDRR